jgi:hypothetical protein
MTRNEAAALCARHNREHPDRSAYRWFPRRDDRDNWSVARAALSAPVPRPLPPEPRPLAGSLT